MFWAVLSSISYAIYPFQSLYNGIKYDFLKSFSSCIQVHIKMQCYKSQNQCQQGIYFFWHDLDFREVYLGQGETTLEYRKYEGSSNISTY